MELESELDSFVNLMNFQVHGTICKFLVYKGLYNFVKDFFLPYQQYYYIHKDLKNNKSLLKQFVVYFWRHRYSISDWQVTVTVANHVK